MATKKAVKTKKTVKIKKAGPKKGKKSVKVKVVKKKPNIAKPKKKNPVKKNVVEKHIAEEINPVNQIKQEDEETVEKKEGEDSYFAKWTSPEHVMSKEDSFMYYIAVFLSLVAVVWYLFQGGFIVVLTFSVLLVVILLQLFITPRHIEYLIDLDGITISDILYPYRDVDSFEVDIREDTHILRIKLKSAFLPVKDINLGDQDPYYIRAVLENFLVESNIEATLFSFGKEDPDDEYFSDEELEKFIEDTEKKKGRNKQIS